DKARRQQMPLRKARREEPTPPRVAQMEACQTGARSSEILGALSSQECSFISSNGPGPISPLNARNSSGQLGTAASKYLRRTNMRLLLGARGGNATNPSLIFSTAVAATRRPS